MIFSFAAVWDFVFLGFCTERQALKNKLLYQPNKRGYLFAIEYP